MDNKLNILIITGTVRQGRVGRKITDWYHTQAVELFPEVNFRILDAAEINLPLFNEPAPPRLHKYSPLQERLAESIAWADAYVMITGEYNHSIPGSMKNLLDYVSAEWARKPAAFLGYGASGGIRAIEHIIQILNSLGVASTSNHITINAVWEALDDNGIPKEGYIFGGIENQLSDLIWWAQTLKSGRQKNKPH